MNKDGIFFFVVSAILLVLALTGILWFGISYFFSAISLLIGTFITFEDIIFLPQYKVRKSYPLIFIGVPLVLMAMLPIVIYGDNPIVYLDVEYISTIIAVLAVFIGLIGIIIIISGIYGLLYGDKKANNSLKNSKIKEKQAQAIESQFRMKVVNKNLSRISQLKKEYGPLTKEIKIIDKNIEFDNKILLFESSEIVVIQNKTYKFSDIIKCDIVDKQHEVKDIISMTKVSQGNSIGRAVVGGVIGGGVGAVIGGVTAKKKTSANERILIIHNYEICLTLNNLSNPQIIIKLGDDEIKTREIAAIFSIIIERKKI